MLNRPFFGGLYYALVDSGLLRGLSASLNAIFFVIRVDTASIPIQVPDMAKVIEPPIVAISDNITAVSAGEDIAVR